MFAPSFHTPRAVARTRRISSVRPMVSEVRRHCAIASHAWPPIHPVAAGAGPFLTRVDSCRSAPSSRLAGAVRGVDLDGPQHGEPILDRTSLRRRTCPTGDPPSCPVLRCQLDGHAIARQQPDEVAPRRAVNVRHDPAVRVVKPDREQRVRQLFHHDSPIPVRPAAHDWPRRCASNRREKTAHSLARRSSSYSPLRGG